MSEEVKCPNCFYMRKGSGLILGGQCCNPDSRHCGKAIDKSKGCDKGEFWRPECVICRQTLHKELQTELKVCKDALESIAKNTCCDSCQEAALVAKKALKKTGLKIEGDRILTDEQLIELHNDIRDGEIVLVSTEYRDRFEAAVRKLLLCFPDEIPEGQEIESFNIPAQVVNEVRRLLGPAPPFGKEDIEKDIAEKTIPTGGIIEIDGPGPKEPPKET